MTDVTDKKCLPEKGIGGRIFSVMRRRDDLPEMTWPLAVLLIVGVALFSAAAGLLGSPADETVSFASKNVVGVISCLPLLPLAACLYALIILLWRRFASLLATPVAFAVMLAFGVELFTAAVVCVSLLFVSYVYAVSLISRETRFKRLTCLTLSIALCLVLTIIAWIGLHFESFSEFGEVYMSEVPKLVGEVYSAQIERSMAYTTASLSYQIPEVYLQETARDIIVMCPAYIGMVSIALAWLVEFLTQTAFRVLDCEDYFIDLTRRITMPFSYAVVYAGVFVLSLMTSAEYNPMLYAMLKSVLYVMLLPCAAVGISGLMRSLEDKLYYFTREKLLAAIILVFALAFLGVFPFLLIVSAVGAGVVIKNNLKKTGDGE